MNDNILFAIYTLFLLGWPFKNFQTSAQILIPRSYLLSMQACNVAVIWHKYKSSCTLKHSFFVVLFWYAILRGLFHIPKAFPWFIERIATSTDSTRQRKSTLTIDLPELPSPLTVKQCYQIILLLYSVVSYELRYSGLFSLGLFVVAQMFISLDFDVKRCLLLVLKPLSGIDWLCGRLPRFTSN